MTNLPKAPRPCTFRDYTIDLSSVDWMDICIWRRKGGFEEAEYATAIHNALHPWLSLKGLLGDNNQGEDILRTLSPLYVKLKSGKTAIWSFWAGDADGFFLSLGGSAVAWMPEVFINPSASDADREEAKIATQHINVWEGSE